MLDSVRARLTLWHSAMLALVLVAFTTATYLFLAELTRQRTEASLHETAHAYARAVALEADDHPPLEAVEEALHEFRFNDRSVRVYDAAARLVASSDTAETVVDSGAGFPTTATPRLRSLLARAEGEPCAELHAGSQAVHACAAETWVAGARFYVVVLQSEALEAAVLHAFVQAAAVAIPLALLLAALGGLWLARKSLQPAVAMGEQAARISAQSLDARLPVANPRDELGRLAGSFNALLGRLESAFGRQRQFMADASHELRTPIAVLRAEADVALSQRERAAGDYRESLEVMRGEAQRLGRIVEDLFLLARADADDHPLHPGDLYLEEVVAESLRAARPLAERAGVTLEPPPDAEAPYRGDEALLRRLLMNLLDNAIKHTPPGGRVALSLEREGGGYAIGVRDSGDGIPPEVQPHVFERFVRADGTRPRAATAQGSGAGLGLAIARWIAEAHGGSLTLARTGPQGTEFRLFLPAAPGA